MVVNNVFQRYEKPFLLSTNLQMIVSIDVFISFNEIAFWKTIFLMRTVQSNEENVLSFS